MSPHERWQIQKWETRVLVLGYEALSFVFMSPHERWQIQNWETRVPVLRGQENVVGKL